MRRAKYCFTFSTFALRSRSLAGHLLPMESELMDSEETHLGESSIWARLLGCCQIVELVSSFALQASLRLALQAASQPASQLNGAPIPRLIFHCSSPSAANWQAGGMQMSSKCIPFHRAPVLVCGHIMAARFFAH